MIIRHPALERGSRALQSTAASLLAAGTLVGAPFLLFALAYKTYNLVVLGHWYVWGAPTPIGTCNRLMSYALIANLVIGLTMLVAARIMRTLAARETSTLRVSAK